MWIICTDVTGKLLRCDIYQKILWRWDWFILENFAQFQRSENLVLHSDGKPRRLRRLQPGESQEVSEALLWSSGNIETFCRQQEMVQHLGSLVRVARRHSVSQLHLGPRGRGKSEWSHPGEGRRVRLVTKHWETSLPASTPLYRFTLIIQHSLVSGVSQVFPRNDKPPLPPSCEPAACSLPDLL